MAHVWSPAISYIFGITLSLIHNFFWKGREKFKDIGLVLLFPTMGTADINEESNEIIA